MSVLTVALIGCNELKDSRDGKTYRTVKIGKQVWMAENMDYETEYSRCENDDAENCAKYGRLYKWNTVLDVCPEGWHLPSKVEFETLLMSVGGVFVAGEKLKSKVGWYKGGDAIDAFGFSALPAGCFGDGRRELACFWSSTKDGSSDAYYMSLMWDRDSVQLSSTRQSDGLFSVRCLQD